ncbi:hypothetical protein [Candidatus Methanocrinis natronophilus]|uniref:Uncharacterized protein n=1 Tax=Candidatus Methanocrinis natronophilus TaxID=3033396 RepID=A0ABT5X7Y2_9EURY|nr:hypothetical protein [Candidatus Methanocrinis natronophilus]MDF0590806.1 hypothetical protein [Candidatus Methanocrinis natronophilus]
MGIDPQTQTGMDYQMDAGMEAEMGIEEWRGGPPREKGLWR